MSVLRCTICEENRNVLTHLVQDILKTLGTSANGHSTLNQLICTKCQSPKKNFPVFIHDAEIEVASDAIGNYSLTQNANKNHHNQLAIINSVKSSLEENLTCHIDELQHAFIADGKIICICGNSKFTNANFMV